ncbi:hypothetical protein SS05631_c35850 [Sinorhizobium sp. CCBAU 05631]|nr:hypothetical protein SS05631_c35850 [Sinorhizobium sp. CCBAU 05631]
MRWAETSPLSIRAWCAASILASHIMTRLGLAHGPLRNIRTVRAILQ